MTIPKGRPFVLNETDADESLLVGTRQQLEALTHAILRALEAPAHEANWHGIRVSQPRFDAALTDQLADVVLTGLAVVESEGDRRALVNAIRTNCGDVAINWEGVDAHDLPGTHNSPL